MELKLPTAPNPDAARLARAEARLLADLSRLRPDPATDVLAPGESPTLSPAQVQWRGPQGSWEATGAAGARDGRYRFGEVFARGGLGTVRRAEDRKLGRTVAIKELLRLDPASVQRFVREAEITARLQHPGIVPLHDLGRDAEGRPFLCMKLVDGDTLEQAIAASADLPARLGLLRHLIAAADAVAYAHRHGVIHRDLKPANILVGELGETVVIDWGLAKDLAHGTDEPAPGEQAVPDTISDLTAAGSLLGTLRYMPPEQARGEAVDPRSDVYALGASLYHLLAGAPPFRGRGTAAVLGELLAGTPGPLPAGTPRALAAIVARAMAVAPADRYDSAAALADDLRRYCAGGLVGAHDYSLAEVGRLWLRRHRAAAAIAAVSLLTLSAVGGAAVARISAARADAVEGRQAALAAGELAGQRADAAEQARVRADRTTDRLRLAQARSALADEPAAAIGWLAQLGEDPDHDDATRTLALAARASGLPVRTLRGPQRPIELATTLPDGTIVAREEEGGLWRWGPGEAVGEPLGPAGELTRSADGRAWAVARRGEVEVHRAGEAVARVALPGGPDDLLIGPGLGPGGRAVFGELKSAGDDLVELDLASGEAAALAVPPALAGVRSWTVAADGRRVAGLRERTLVVWDRDGGAVHTQELPDEVSGRARFSADGAAVLVTLADGPTPWRKIAVWRAGEALRVVDASAAALLTDVAVFSAPVDGGTRVWAEDRRTGALRWTRSFHEERGDLSSLVAGPDERLLLLHHGDDAVAVLDAQTGALLPTPRSSRHWLGHGGLLVTRDGVALQVYDPLHGPWRALGPATPPDVRATAVAPGGGLLVRQRADGAVERVDVARGVVEPLPAGCGAWTRDPHIGQHVGDDGRVLLSGAALCLWDAQGAREAALPPPAIPMLVPDRVAHASFTPDGVRVALHFGPDNLLEWRGADAGPRVLGATGPAAAEVPVDGGRSLAVVGVRGGVRLLGAGAPRELVPDDEQRWSNAGLAVAPDQRTLAVYRRGASEVRVVDALDGATEVLGGAAFDGPLDPSPRVRFDASGQHVAVLDGGRVTRWSRARPDAPVSVAVPGGVALAFTADPQRLAVQTRHGELLLVDPEAGLSVPLRPRGDATLWIGQDAAGGVLRLSSAGELQRWRDELPAGALPLRRWLDDAALRLGAADRSDR